MQTYGIDCLMTEIKEHRYLDEILHTLTISIKSVMFSHITKISEFSRVTVHLAKTNSISMINNFLDNCFIVHQSIYYLSNSIFYFYSQP